MQIKYHYRKHDGERVWFEECFYDSRFAPMKALLEAAHKLDQRLDRKVIFVRNFFDEDVSILGGSNNKGWHMNATDTSFRMDVFNGKITVHMGCGNFDMVHTVKKSKFNPERILLHFERCVEEARAATKVFFQNFHTLDYNFWFADFDITSAGAVKVTLVYNHPSEILVHEETVHLSEVNNIPVVKIADDMMNEILGKQIEALHQELAKYDDIE